MNESYSRIEISFGGVDPLQICEVIFYQDDGNNCCIAIVIELFFEEVMIKKNEQIGLICGYIWYYLFQEIYNSLDNKHHNMGFLMFGEN